MGLFDSLAVSASGLSAERLRMDVTAENLANAQSTQGPDGQPYRRKSVVLAATDGGDGFAGALARAQGATGTSAGAPAGAVEVAAIIQDANPGKRVYDPGHPDADGQGYVTMPNVDTVTEMVDLISASRAYEANATAMTTAKQLFTKTLELLR
jgi:flagellar basal-body rod protein FlgC